jgi:glycosyltransferase involved in cell wall biosynthesis/LmbE family N-acetylglucosaminyl deacetylase
MPSLNHLLPVTPSASTQVPAGRVLVLAPHPDDEIFGCAGALLSHVEQHHPCHVCIVSSGELQAHNSIEAREAESQKALQLLGVEVPPQFWRLPDGQLDSCQDLDQKILHLLQDLQISRMYAPSPWESHPDHQAVSRAAIEAARQYQGELDLVFYEVGEPLQANFLLDCTGIRTKKLQAMDCFTSQNQQHNYQAYIEGLNQFRAYHIGQQSVFAEAYLCVERSKINTLLTYLHAQPAPLSSLPIPRTQQLSVTVMIRSSQRDTLARAIASVGQQTYRNIEVLVVNTLPSAHPAIENTGLPVRLIDPASSLSRAAAANLLLDGIGTDLALFLDDDDYILPTHIEGLVARLAIDETLIFAHSDTRMENGLGEKIGEFHAHYDPAQLLSGNLFPIHSVLFRREPARSVRFDPLLDIYEDWFFWIELSKLGSIARVPGETAVYVKQQQSSGVEVPELQNQYRQMIYQKSLALLDLAQYQHLMRAVAQVPTLSAHLASGQNQLQDTQAQLQQANQRHAQFNAIADERLQHIQQLQQVADSRLLDIQSLQLQQQALNASLQHAQSSHEALRAANHQLRQEQQELLRDATDQLTALQANADAQKNQLDAIHAEFKHTVTHLSIAAASNHPALFHHCQQLLAEFDDPAKREQLRNLLISRNLRTHFLLRPFNSLKPMIRSLMHFAHTAQGIFNKLSARLQLALRNYGGPLAVAKKIGQKVSQQGLRGLVGAYRAYPVSDNQGYTPVALDQQAPEGNTQTEYQRWIEKFDHCDHEVIRQYQAMTQDLAAKPLISIVMPVYNAEPRWLCAAIDSVLAQAYPHWELCIADDASTHAEVRETLERYTTADERIKVVYRPQNGHISAASNSALALATGHYIALMDNDDEIHPLALYHVAAAINQHPDAQLFYSDEDKISEQGIRVDPYFKSDWNPDLFLSQNMFSHLGVYAKTLLDTIGGFRLGLEGSQDYDLVLRCLDHVRDEQIIHIPHVLYHWRIIPGSTATSGSEKPYAFLAAQRAVQEYLDRKGVKAEVGEAAPGVHMLRVRYQLPDQHPLVSIIIPTRNAEQLVRQCIESVLTKTSYSNYEIILVDNGSDDESAVQYFNSLANEGKIRLLRDDSPFNYSALNNKAVAIANGSLLCLLNNDIEVINADWLDEMVSHALRPEIGAVGARLWYPNDTLQHAGVIIGYGGVAGHAHHGLTRGNPGYFGRAWLIQNYTAVTAACLLVKKSIYEEVGGLNETNLTVAFNDVDFCLRIHQAGYRNLWTPYAELYHHESATRGSDMEPAKRARFVGEVQFMETTYAAILPRDPAYNPNLALNGAPFALNWTPR